MSFTEGFYGIPLAFYGTPRVGAYGYDDAHVVDEATAVLIPRVVFGPPVATIVTVSESKVSLVDGCDEATVTFTFNQPVDAWMVRVGSRTAFDGTLAASWFSDVPGVGDVDGFGEMAFGTGPFGLYSSTALPISGQATVAGRFLHEGVNEVVVYGRNASGEWSVHPVMEGVTV